MVFVGSLPAGVGSPSLVTYYYASAVSLLFRPRVHWGRETLEGLVLEARAIVSYALGGTS